MLRRAPLRKQPAAGLSRSTLAFAILVAGAALAATASPGPRKALGPPAAPRGDCSEGGGGSEGQSLWRLDLTPTPHSKRLIRRDTRRGWTIHDVSPDGRWIVYAADEGLGVATVSGTQPRTVAKNPTTPTGTIHDARWSPDGRKIAFSTLVGGGRLTIYVVNRDGSGVRQVGDGHYFEWSADSRRIAFLSNAPTDRTILGVVAIAERRQLQIAPATVPYRPIWSPSGKWVAYQNRKDERIHLIRPDGSGDRRIDTPGFGPSWSPDGSALVFSRAYWGQKPPPVPLALAVADLQGRLVRSFEEGAVDEPEWSPSGAEIVYPRWKDESLTTSSQLFSIRADGSGRRKLTHDRDLDEHDGDTEDVVRVIWVRRGPLQGRRLFYLRAVCE